MQAIYQLIHNLLQSADFWMWLVGCGFSAATGYNRARAYLKSKRGNTQALPRPEPAQEQPGKITTTYYAPSADADYSEEEGEIRQALEALLEKVLEDNKALRAEVAAYRTSLDTPPSIIKIVSDVGNNSPDNTGVSN